MNSGPWGLPCGASFSWRAALAALPVGQPILAAAAFQAALSAVTGGVAVSAQAPWRKPVERSLKGGGRQDCLPHGKMDKLESAAKAARKLKLAPQNGVAFIGQVPA